MNNNIEMDLTEVVEENTKWIHSPQSMHQWRDAAQNFTKLRFHKLPVKLVIN